METSFGIDLRYFDPANEEDQKLPRMSYSKMDLFNNCMMRGKLKYVDGNYSDVSTLAMEIGTILHKGLEMKADLCAHEVTVTQDKLDEIIRTVYEGCDEITEKNDKHLPGINELKKKYFEDWCTPDKEGRTYDQKLKVYTEDILPTRMTEPDWEIMGFEIPFEFIYDNRIRFNGFIDRLDRNVHTGDYRVVDYKTNRKVFDDAHIKTPLQMWVYACAVFTLYNQFPTSYAYDFILLDKQQASPFICTKGWEKRAIKKVASILDAIDSAEKSGVYAPKPSPLCYWCTYHSDSPNSDPKYRGLCQYHSLWTPENKTFATLNKWEGSDMMAKPKETDESKATKIGRKLFF